MILFICYLDPRLSSNFQENTQMGIKIFAFLTLSFMIAYSTGTKVTISVVSDPVDPAPLTLDVAYSTTVIEMMKVASSINSQYGFGGTYYGSLGWYIEMYNNIENNLATHYCWFFYVQLPHGNATKPDVGVSVYHLMVDGTDVTFKYEYNVGCKEYSKDSQDKTEL